MSLKSGDETVSGDWVLDTLKDEVCVEDGYALMTIYKLDHFVYDLNVGDPNSSGITNRTVKIAANADSATKDQAGLILENVSLQFKDMSGTGGSGRAETTISNAKMYRLPFDLQVTTRTAAKTFWETLTVTGYSTLTDSNGKNIEVFKDNVFYYCPDFAKNAVNPDGGSNTSKPSEPGGEASPIYVRSARQLNALSRSIYYWNQNVEHGGVNLYFKQETDIDFGKYVKTYCGQPFNLMDTSDSNPYKNLPIGTPNKTTDDTRPSNFQNTYDGQCHKIIDYCLEITTAMIYADKGNATDNYRFAGLFGEVEYATLKNIVMVASVPDDGDGHYSAYVKSAWSKGDQRAGVGALAGLLFVRREPNLTRQTVAVENCSVSGYHVEYTGNGGLGYAIGGLAGFSFGNVSNSSAVCNVYGKNTSASVEGRIGGLIGSMNGQSSITNCYTGGTIYASTSAIIGGISGGYAQTWGYLDGNANARKMTIKNCYSYCTLNNSNLTGTYAYNVYPIAVASRDYTLTVENCYYLTDTMTYVNTQYMNGVSDKSYDELRKIEFKDDKGNIISGKLPEYPFPAIVKGTNGEFVHYGDWPLKTP